MDKLRYLKTPRQNARDLVKYGNNAKQARYQDTFLSTPARKVPFEHNWSLMAHMHDLRVWTLAYAPGNANNLQRLQEVHRLNNEMWYQISKSIWHRFFYLVAFWFAINKLFKHKYMNRGAIDSHDPNFRESPAHM